MSLGSEGTELKYPTDSVHIIWLPQVKAVQSYQHLLTRSNVSGIVIVLGLQSQERSRLGELLLASGSVWANVDIRVWPSLIWFILNLEHGFQWDRDAWVGLGL